MTKYVDNISFVTQTCCKCNMPFAMTERFNDARISDHTTWYCPAGHPQIYRKGASEEEKLKAELARTESMLEAAQARSSKIAQERDDVTRAHRKMRASVMNGVCPCCNRTFQNLMRHMKSEHAGELTLRNLRNAFCMTQGAVAKEIGISVPYVSSYECEKYVPQYAKMRIESWMERHSGQPDTTESGK